ncbi:L,D-transpeptidase family protein [Streptomyces beijiangensis]|uniref:Murein L,D-transpeptidase n=1 Tax=Streptomyces beijiangensis TaxID=163361 RepID=A0A939JGJ6_9ACTN|nr:L,D-transpeptidase family protein [Streptomyces beijiangensis]MBO0511622.1 murein L,D-transpeptidase [Streptomyces beijiangensis]
MQRNRIRRGLAAAAVVAMAAGCTAQAATGTPEAKPSAGSGGSTTPTPEPTPTPSATGTGTTTATPAPSQTETQPPKPKPEPKVLMARGDKGSQVRELQARLRQIAWFDGVPTGTYGAATSTAVQGFQGKRGLAVTGATDTVTWQKLLAMTTRPTADELNGTVSAHPAGKLDARCLHGRVLCISKTSRSLSWVNDGKVLATMDVRFGSQYTPTREGTFSVDFKSRNHVSTIFHTAMPYAMFFSGGQAVHYSADFAARGYNGASHGCVNVRDRAKIAALFDQVRVGDKVVVYW